MGSGGRASISTSDSARNHLFRKGVANEPNAKNITVVHLGLDRSSRVHTIPPDSHWGQKTFPATKPEGIEVFFPNETPGQSYEEVGYIIARKGSEKDAMAFLKDHAAKMGADALLNCEVRVHRRLVIIIIFIPIFEDTYIASGVGIKYTNLPLKGE